METKKTFETVGKIGAFGIGWAIGGMVHSIAKPKGVVDHALTTIGSMGIAFLAGRKFAEEYNKAFGSVLSEVEDNDEIV